MKNKTYKKKIDKEWFKEREKVSRLFDKIDFHKIVYVFLLVFIVSSCSQNSKKNWLTYGTGVGTGMGYSLTNHWKSGTGGNINQVVKITTLSALLGVFMGSIIDNIYQEEQEV